MNSPPGRG